MLESIRGEFFAESLEKKVWGSQDYRHMAMQLVTRHTQY